MAGPLVTVIAHGGAQNVFENHLPWWKAHGWPILVVHPQNARVQTDQPNFAWEPKSHHGPCAWRRLYWMVQYLAATEHSHHLIFEYDSICLNPTPKLLNGLLGNCFDNKNTGNRSSRYAWRYANPPWMIDKASLRAMAHTASHYEAIYEDGLADRYLSALALISGVPVLDFPSPGYSQATIKDEHRDELGRAIASGSEMIHGIKTKSILSFCKERYERIRSP